MIETETIIGVIRRSQIDEFVERDRDRLKPVGCIELLEGFLQMVFQGVYASD
jgi:hypothetical protein